MIADKSAPRIWDLSAERRTPAEMRDIAHVLSAHALVSGTSALRPLKLPELREAWERSRKALGAW